MENKIIDTLLGEVRLIREERETVTVVYKGELSHMHKDFLKVLILASKKPELKSDEKFRQIRENPKARKIFMDILESPNCLYTIEEVRDIAFAYVVFLHNEE